MDIEEFRVRGKEMVDYICEFMSNIHTRRVTPDIGPGYLRPLLPSGPPNDPESWDEIMKDVESKIMPGVSICEIGKELVKYQMIYLVNYCNAQFRLQSLIKFNRIDFSFILNPARVYFKLNNWNQNHRNFHR